MNKEKVTMAMICEECENRLNIRPGFRAINWDICDFCKQVDTVEVVWVNEEERQKMGISLRVFPSQESDGRNHLGMWKWHSQYHPLYWETFLYIRYKTCVPFFTDTASVTPKMIAQVVRNPKSK